MPQIRQYSTDEAIPGIPCPVLGIPQFMRDIEKLGGLPAWLYQGFFSVRATTITRGSGIEAQGVQIQH